MCVPSFVQELEARQQDYTVEWYSEHSTTQAEHDEIKNIRQEIPREQQMQATTHQLLTETWFRGFEKCSLNNHPTAGMHACLPGCLHRSKSIITDVGVCHVLCCMQLSFA
jgi:hypothetical protein